LLIICIFCFFSCEKSRKNQRDGIARKAISNKSLRKSQRGWHCQKKVVLNKRVFARVSESVTTRTVISDKKVIASVSNGGTEKQCHIQTRK